MSSARSSASSIRRGTCVSSAISKPGSRLASSGNSRSSDRQNASMVLMSTSPDRSRMSRQSCWSGPAASARFRSSLRMRPRISAAAFRVNVIARMFAGSTPRLSRLRYRSTSTCVLPVPADASRTTLCAGSTARCRAAASGSKSRVESRVRAPMGSRRRLWALDSRLWTIIERQPAQTSPT